MVYGQSLPLQFPLDVDASYHAAGLAKGEDLFNKEDLSQFQASRASHNISQHIATELSWVNCLLKENDY